MSSHLQGLTVTRVSLVDRAAVRDPADPTQPRRFVMYKAETAPTPNEGDDDVSTTTIDKAELDPAVRAALEKAEKDAADAQELVEKAGKDMKAEKEAREKAEAERDQLKKDETVQDEPIDKADLPEPVRAALEKAEKDGADMREALAKAEKNAADAHDLAKAEESRRITQEFITKAETGDLRGLPGAPNEMGPVLKALSEAAPEAYATLEKSVLLPAVAQIRESNLFKEAGAGGEGPPPESSVGKFRKAVADLQKSETGLSKSAAMERVRREQPDLEKAMARELRGEEAMASTERFAAED